MFDREKTGFMSASDFRSIMTSLGESMTEGEADRMVKDADRKGEGLVNIDGLKIFTVFSTPSPFNIERFAKIDVLVFFRFCSDDVRPVTVSLFAMP